MTDNNPAPDSPASPDSPTDSPVSPDSPVEGLNRPVSPDTGLDGPEGLVSSPDSLAEGLDGQVSLEEGFDSLVRTISPNSQQGLSAEGQDGSLLDVLIDTLDPDGVELDRGKGSAVSQARQATARLKQSIKEQEQKQDDVVEWQDTGDLSADNVRIQAKQKLWEHHRSAGWPDKVWVAFREVQGVLNDIAEAGEQFQRAIQNYAKAVEEKGSLITELEGYVYAVPDNDDDLVENNRLAGRVLGRLDQVIDNADGFRESLNVCRKKMSVCCFESAKKVRAIKDSLLKEGGAEVFQTEGSLEICHQVYEHLHQAMAGQMLLIGLLTEKDKQAKDAHNVDYDRFKACMLTTIKQVETLLT